MSARLTLILTQSPHLIGPSLSSIAGTIDDESLHRLDSVLADLDVPFLRTVHGFLQRMQGLRELSPRLDARGCLTLKFISKEGVQGGV
ncbi:hypothetical protein C8F04DRAFT_1266037 [Mycena alexandri]|uniref:Uncharacterized protein n=1 Tax=Mycena alexandri TaxID=1745969 RepID=A0AAD6SJ04_9AGAR|nr:hypothetical protein C8F04DRAFT_1266037 [Mycena alexandri]